MYDITFHLSRPTVDLTVGGLGSTTGSASDSRSEGRGFDSH